MQNAECKVQNGRTVMNDNVSVEKSFDFAVRIVNLHKYLTQEQKEYVMSKQLLRCGTSIGANISEAQRGQSMADFAAKMNIALKEANEAEYWLRLLYRTEYLTKSQFESMYADVQELLGILIAICRTSNAKK
jgi:four helix bundle protein